MWRSQLHLTYSRPPLAHKCGWLVVSIRSVTACYEKPRIGLFACLNFEIEDVEALYYGPLEYNDLGRESQVTKEYDEEYEEVRAESI